MYTKIKKTETNYVNTTPVQAAIRTRSLVMTALFTAILCVSAYISIPLPAGSHITLLNFFVLLIALVFPAQQSFFTAIIWLLLGIVGVPVFIGGNAGISYIVGGWGGYSIAFVLITILIPRLRGRKYRRIYYTILAIGAAIFIDIFGAGWLMVLTGITVKQAITAGILPFLALDVLKAIVAAQIAPQFKRIVDLT